MEITLSALRWVHIIAGFIGLSAYWVPIFARKGSVNHRRLGKIFINAGYTVIVAAIASLSLKASILLSKGTPFSEAPNFWSISLFLGYLALVVGIMLHHATEVLRSKKDQTALNTFLNRSLGFTAIAASIGILAFALIVSPDAKFILIALSPIGILTGSQVLGYISGRNRSKRQWWYEHMGVMITAGISFHTAFFVFGASRLFDIGLTGLVAVIPWILPAAIGVPGLIIWERYYRKKFNDPKPGKQMAAV